MTNARNTNAANREAAARRRPLLVRGLLAKGVTVILQELQTVEGAARRGYKPAPIGSTLQAAA